MDDGMGQGVTMRQGMADHRAGEGRFAPSGAAQGWLAILKRTWEEVGADNIGIIAAGIAFTSSPRSCRPWARSC